MISIEGYTPLVAMVVNFSLFSHLMLHTVFIIIMVLLLHEHPIMHAVVNNPECTYIHGESIKQWHSQTARRPVLFRVIVLSFSIVGHDSIHIISVSSYLVVFGAQTFF